MIVTGTGVELYSMAITVSRRRLPLSSRGHGKWKATCKSLGVRAMTTSTPLPMFQSARSFILEQFQSFLDADLAAVQLANLLAAEEAIVAFSQELANALLAQFVTVRSAQVRQQPPTCEYGRAMGVHRMTFWPHTTLFGTVQVPDPYFYCRDCRASARPLHRLLGTEHEAHSMGLQAATVDLVADESCGSAVDKLERHHPGVHMDRTAALRLLHRHGQTAREFLDMHLAQAQQRAVVPPVEQPEGVADLEVEFDAGMIPVGMFKPIVTVQPPA